MTISKTLDFVIKVFYHLKQNLIVEEEILEGTFKNLLKITLLRSVSIN